MGTLTKKELLDFLTGQGKNLSTITEYNTLQERWKSSPSNSELQKQIEVRMMELNKGEFDYNVLQERWNTSTFDSEFQKQIEVRIMDLNKGEFDYNVLQERWKSSHSNSELRKPIEVRMMELNKGEFDYNVLQTRWDTSPSDSELEKQIEVRMMELLSLISDTNQPKEFVTLIKTTMLEDVPAFFKQPLKDKINSLIKII